MYLGHFTKRVRSRFGWILPPVHRDESTGAYCQTVSQGSTQGQKVRGISLTATLTNSKIPRPLFNEWIYFFLGWLFSYVRSRGYLLGALDLLLGRLKLQPRAGIATHITVSMEEETPYRRCKVLVAFSKAYFARSRQMHLPSLRVRLNWKERSTWTFP